MFEKHLEPLMKCFRKSKYNQRPSVLWPITNSTQGRSYQSYIRPSQMIPGHNSYSENSKRWSSSHTDGGNVKWLWPANNYYTDFFEANRIGTRTGIAELTFNSKIPLEAEHLRQTLLHFQRKVPPARIMLRPRAGQLWFCELQEPGMVFEVLSSDADLRAELNRLNEEGFQATDTVPWKARLIPRGPDTPCYVEGLKEKYPYQYDFSCMFHHAIIDGIDCVMICNWIHKILDDVLGGRIITDEQTGVFRDYREIDQILLSERRERLTRNKEHFEFIKSTIPSYNSVPMILQAFPRNTAATAYTDHIVKIIDAQTSKILHTKCVEAGVTFNSFCVAVANIGAMEASIEAGLIQDSYTINSISFVNSRRYLPSEIIHGCFQTPLSYTSQVQGNTHKFFWDYCKKVNHELHSSLKERRSLDQRIVREKMEADLPKYNYTDNLRSVLHDFSVNYYKDATQLAPGVGEFVQLSNITSFNKIHKFINCLMHEIMIFRGKTQYTLSYATDYFTDETAGLIVDKFFAILKQLVK